MRGFIRCVSELGHSYSSTTHNAPANNCWDSLRSRADRLHACKADGAGGGADGARGRWVAAGPPDPPAPARAGCGRTGQRLETDGPISRRRWLEPPEAEAEAV